MLNQSSSTSVLQLTWLALESLPLSLRNVIKNFPEEVSSKMCGFARSIVQTLLPSCEQGCGICEHSRVVFLTLNGFGPVSCREWRILSPNLPEVWLHPAPRTWSYVPGMSLHRVPKGQMAGIPLSYENRFIIALMPAYWQMFLLVGFGLRLVCILQHTICWLVVGGGEIHSQNLPLITGDHKKTQWMWTIK